MTHEEMRQTLEGLAADIHGVYQREAKRQGDVRHKDDYADLPENIKDYDRVLARWILGNFGNLEWCEQCGTWHFTVPERKPPK